MDILPTVFSGCLKKEQNVKTISQKKKIHTEMSLTTVLIAVNL